MSQHQPPGEREGRQRKLTVERWFGHCAILKVGEGGRRKVTMMMLRVKDGVVAMALQGEGSEDPVQTERHCRDE